MIEVEKKFRPTKEQLENLLKDCIFIKEVVNHDIYFDYPDYRLVQKGTRLRKRNSELELKVSEGEDNENDLSAATEIEDEEGIQKYFGIHLPVAQFIEENLIEAINIKTNRKKYQKGDFCIDVDDLDFGYQCVEIELMVKDSSGIPEAFSRIKELALSYGFSLEEIPAKKKEYFRIVKPEVFKKLYPEG